EVLRKTHLNVLERSIDEMQMRFSQEHIYCFGAIFLRSTCVHLFYTKNVSRGTPPAELTVTKPLLLNNFRGGADLCDISQLMHDYVEAFPALHG
ncbi:hypothetical protein NDU88_001227, partial [Pleurodeles waltl]